MGSDLTLGNLANVRDLTPLVAWGDTVCLQGEITMSMERWIRLITGCFILTSLALAVWVDRRWLWFTAFVGANLALSALTRWCLMEKILARLGVKPAGCMTEPR